MVKKIKVGRISMMGAIIFTQVVAQADVSIRKAADWSLNESDDGQTCFISTDNSTYGNGGDSIFNPGGSTPATIYFTISKSKNKPEQPAELIIRYASGKNKSNGAEVAVSGANTVTAVDLNGNKTIYWNVSRGLSQMLNQIKSGKSISVKSTGKGDKASLSNSGYQDVLKDMMDRCNSGLALSNSDFESKFFEGVSDITTNVDSSKAQTLRGLYFAAYEAAYHIANANAELQKILDSYKPFQVELDNNRSEHDDILNSKLPATRNALTQAQKQQVDAKTEIDRLQKIIDEITLKVQASQKAYDQARAAIAPFEPQYNEITSRLNNAKRSLASAQSRLQFIDSRTAQLNNIIVQLNSEYRSLYDGLPYKQSIMNTAYSNYTQATQRRQMFDPNREYIERLRRDFAYNQMLRDREQAHRDVDNAQAMLNQLVQRQAEAQRASDMCHSNNVVAQIVPQITTTTQTNNTMAQVTTKTGEQFTLGGLQTNTAPNQGEPPRGPGGGLIPGAPGSGHGPGPGPSDGGGIQPVPQPAPQPQQPVQDCTTVDNLLNGAKSDVINQQNAVNQLRGRERMINDRINEVEMRTRRQVDDEYRRLVDIERQAQYEYQMRANEVSSDQNRLNQIYTNELPQAQNELNSLTNERPQVVTQIQNQSNAVESITNELISFKKSSDWDNKTAQVNKTATQLSSDQSDLKNNQTLQVKARASLQDGITKEKNARDTISSLEARVVTLDKRSEVLKEKLSHLPEEREKFDVYIEQQKAKFSTSKANYIKNL